MTLNNPKGLNALNKAMIDIMQPQLQVGRNSRQCRRYILLTLSWSSSAIRKVAFLQPRHSERRRQRLLCGRRCQRSAAEGVAEARALLLDGDEVTDIAHMMQPWYDPSKRRKHGKKLSISSETNTR